ncbi:exported hypothetical protein [Desulfosarcina cetonica]|uniref:hypothetical protein n=1 Tax=Desulfosarcina cetonica TaxID=90730 RepID=UPI0006D0BA23|nr:hypothetical protein [Desulfosarcina cetonica]VTR67530.1 exported hypothetical protein [Desulfosarcina cetonica]
MKRFLCGGIICLWLGMPFVAHALTAQEILLLKQNGVSEKTIQMMLQSEIAAARAQTATEQAMGTRTITRPNGQPAIVYSTGNASHETATERERHKEQQAWEMLRHIIVDTRGETAASQSQ